jgi:hypothetical protein
MRKLHTISALMIYGLINSTSASAASWDETLQGDLSNNGLAPSALTLDIGINSVKGSFGGTAPERDYLAITIQSGMQLSALLVGDGFIQNDARSFIGVQAGSIMTVSPTSGSSTGLLGFTHVQPGLGFDLLPDIGNTAAFGAIGFTGPLSAGTYTFWIQDTSGNGSFSYDFVVTTAPVPEPETYAMLLAGLGLMGTAARRRKQKQS